MDNRKPACTSVHYPSEADSFVYLAYADLNSPRRCLALHQSGSSAVSDILLQVYRATEWLSGDTTAFPQYGKCIFQFQTKWLEAEQSVGLTLAPLPDSSDPKSWALAIQFFLASSYYFQLLLLDYGEGSWSQCQIVFAVVDARVSILRKCVDDRFPDARGKLALDRVMEWSNAGGGSGIDSDLFKSQLDLPPIR